MNPWYLVTLAGEPQMWLVSTLVVAITYAFLRKRISEGGKPIAKKLVVVYIISILIVLIMVFLLKNVVQTERPCIPCDPFAEGCNPYCGTDNSFPSGHSAAIFAVFSSIYLVIRKKWFMPLFILPLVVSASRYVLGVHNIIDIVTGAIIGIAVPLIFIKVYEKKPRFLKRLNLVS